MINIFISICCFILTVNCSNYKIKNFQNYTTTKIDYNETLDLKKKQTLQHNNKIVIVDFDTKGIEDQCSFINESIKSKISNQLINHNNIKLIDRSLSSLAKEEMRLLEINGNLQYNGPKEADYIITGKIDACTFTSDYNSKSIKNLLVKLGIITTSIILNSGSGVAVGIIENPITPTYEYTSLISGSLKIIDAKNLEVIKIIPFKEKKYKEEDASSQSNIIRSGMQNASKLFDKNLILETLDKAMEDFDKTIAQSIGIKSYIIERRDYDNNSDPIFLIPNGYDSGIKQKMKVKVIKNNKIKNPINDQYIDQLEYFDGLVSNVVEKNHSWIVFKSKIEASRIKIGDVVIIEIDN